PNGAALEHATVLISTQRASATRALGAAFTGPDGTFTLETTFQADQRVQVPAESILLGTVGAEVQWEALVEDLAVGPKTGNVENRLVVWTYNATDAAGTSQTIATPFHSATRLSVETPQAALTGESIEVNATLKDGLGRPLGSRTVELTWDGTEPPTTRTATTDAGGKAIFTLPAAPQAAQTEVTATFEGTSRLQRATATSDLAIRDPATLTLSAEPSALTAGDPVTLIGELETPDGPVAGAPIELVAGRLTTNTTTDGSGTFELTLTVPETTPSGPFSLLARFPGTEQLAPTEGQASLDVLGTAFLKAPANTTLDRTQGGLLRGQVLDGQGQGLSATVQFTAPGLPALQAVSDVNGAWILPIPSGLPRGQYAGTIEVLADDEQAGAERPFTLTLRGQGALALDALPGVVSRGDTLQVEGTLLDQDGNGVPGEGLVATFLTATDQALTDADGRFQVTLPVPEDAPLGSRALTVSYTGSMGGTLTPTQANRTLAIKDPTTVQLHTEHTPLARPSISGTLLRSNGQAIPGQAITLTLHLAEGQAPVATTQATTSATGTFNASLPGSLAPEATVVTVQATFPGTSTLAETTGHRQVNLTTPLVWDARLPASLPTGRNVPVEGTVRDAEGPAIQEGLVRARIGDTVIGEAPVRDGAFTLPITVPEQITPGEHQVRITLEPLGLHAATPLTGSVTVTTLATVEVTFTDQLRAGAPYQAIATVTDEAGRPMADVTLVYWIAQPGQDPVPATARTNATGQALLAGIAPSGSGDGRAELTVVAKGPQLTKEAAVATAATVSTPGTLSLLPALLIAALVLVLAIAAYLITRRRRQVGEVQQIVEELLTDLEMGNEYQASVLLAYKRLTEHLETYGFLDKPEFTAREFLDAVREALPLPDDQVDAFVGLFEQARYSQHTIGPVDRVRAINQLRTLRQAIEGSAPKEAAT
ncbi:MAG: DUF4129 domain-containing protein, partial [Candidatus Thermoplasmatota archaeon]|nr:DUF4129 domain-containing protein [Candidatus Thermoplasmatota archaeon]